MKHSMSNPSKEYLTALEDCKRHHANTEKTYSGRLFRPHAPYVKWLIDKFGSKSLLDYGSGKGVQYDWFMPKHGKTIREYLGVPVTCYEPAWPPFAQDPIGTFDVVVCTHTLGTIPIQDMEWVVDRIYNLTSDGGVIYIGEKIGKSRKQKAIYTTNADVHHDGWRPEKWMEVLSRKNHNKTVVFAFKPREGGEINHYLHDLPSNRWLVFPWPSNVRPLDITWA